MCLNIFTRTKLSLVPICFIAATGLIGCGSPGGNSSQSEAPASSSSSSAVVTSSSSSPAASSSAPSTGIPAGAEFVYAVNVGGRALSDNGMEYVADRFSSGGTPNSTDDSISGASGAAAVYQTERYGSNYRYEIPVTNAAYSVKLQFVEMYMEAAGDRLFNVTVEGQPVLQSMDLYAEVGHDSAYDEIVNNVLVADGALTIELSAEIDNATLSGLVIYSNDGGQFEEPPEPETCGVPGDLSWTSSGILIGPRGADRAVKDPSIVYYNGKYHVFATVNDGNWRSMYTSFTDFSEAPNATYQAFSPGGSSTVAPQVFYFSPQNRWYIFTQWPAKYTTNSDIENVSGWGSPSYLLSGSNHADALDYWVICDDANCYLYFFKDDGNMYYVRTTIGNFPNFSASQVQIADVQGSGGQSILFEAGNVYKIKGTDTYLLQVEGWGSSEGRRLYRSWTSTSLDGPWQAHKTSESNPFAGLNNVSFPGGQWSQQISHGEMIRDGYDEKMILDTCDMQFLYQGVDLNGYSGDYGGRPYRLGLLRQD